MSEVRTSHGKYHIEIRDARGVVIGDNNVVYQYFLDERYRPLAEHLITFDDLITERTADFVGRAFLDARLAAFMDQHDRGYFVLVGEPGIGKTAWAAHIERELQALHHFNVSAMGIVRPDQALENLCAQIIASFQLDQPCLPVTAGRDGSLLNKLLRQAAERLGVSRSKLVIVIDALDEAQMPSAVRGTNTLYLPSSLPAGVYLVLTRRPQPVLLETAPGTPLDTFTLGADLPDNQADVHAYLQQQATRTEITARLADGHILTERFVEELAERSAGNFMYLAYLLPDIAAGLFDPLNLTGLPQGLRGYYERFWNELESAKGEGREAWTKFYKPVIGLLAAAREPVSAAWIGRILSLDPDEVADFALALWRKFLSRTDVSGEVRWRPYHASFGDFLEDKLDGAKRWHSRIVDYYREACDDRWPELMDVDNAYGLRHMAMHLADAERWEDLHTLVAEGPGGYQPWAQARLGLDGSYAGYEADLDLAWIHAEEKVSCELTTVAPQVRYALIQSSIRALAANISTELLALLVESSIAGWTPISALAFCAQIPEESRRAEALTCLKAYLPVEALRSAFKVARQIADLKARSEALISLATCLPPTEKAGVLAEVLSLLPQICDGYAAVEVLCRLAPLLAEGTQEEMRSRAQALAHTIPNQANRARSLISIFLHFPKESSTTQVAEAWKAVTIGRESHTVARRIGRFAPPLRAAGEWIADAHFAMLLEELAQYLPPTLLAESFEVSAELDNEDSRANALTGLAPFLPLSMLERGLLISEGIQSTDTRLYALSGIMPYLGTTSPGSILKRLGEISSDYYRYRALGRVASYLVPLVPDETLDFIAGIKNEHYRSWALQSVSRYLPATSGGYALVVAQGIVDRLARRDAIVCVATKLHGSDREFAAFEALKLAQAIGDEKSLADSLHLLGQHTMSPKKDEMLRAATSFVRLIENDYERLVAICELAPDLPDPQKSHLLNEAVSLAVRISDVPTRVGVFSRLLSYLSPAWKAELESQAIVSAMAIHDAETRSRSLRQLLPFVQDSLRTQVADKALMSTRLIEDAVSRVQALVALLPYWDANTDMMVIEETVRYARNLERTHDRAQALTALIPYLTSSSREQALADAVMAVRGIEDEDDVAENLTWLAPYLDKERAAKGLEIACQIKDCYARVVAFVGLLPFLPDAAQQGSTLSEALDIARAIPELEYRLMALGMLLPVVQTHQRESLAVEVLKEAMNLQNEEALACVLTSITAFVPAESLALVFMMGRRINNRGQRTGALKTMIDSALQAGSRHQRVIYHAWFGSLHHLTAFQREHLLTDISVLAPLLVKVGGDERAEEVGNAIVDVGRWWP